MRGSWHFKVASFHLHSIMAPFPLHTMFPSRASVVGGVCRSRSEAPCSLYHYQRRLTAQHSKYLLCPEPRYKKSDVREIDVEGNQNSAGATGGPPRAGSRIPLPRERLVRVALEARSWGANPRRSLLGDEALRAECILTSCITDKAKEKVYPCRYAVVNVSRNSSPEICIDDERRLP